MTHLTNVEQPPRCAEVQTNGLTDGKSVGEDWVTTSGVYAKVSQQRAA